MMSAQLAPELHLLQQALKLERVESAIQSALKLLQEHPLNWDTLLSLAAYHSIQPQLLKFLRQIPTAEIPASVLEHLQEAQRGIALRQMYNLGEFIQVNQLLTEEGITIVPYKGFALAQLAYPHYAERESGDIDVYIAAQDLPRIQKLMFARAYVPETGSPDDDALLILQHQGEYNFDRYGAKGRLFHFEFHASASSHKLGLGLSLGELRDQVQPQTLNGQLLPMFNPSAHLLLSALHHGGKDAWASYKQVLDIGMLLARFAEQIDWLWLSAFTRQRDMDRLLWVALGLAQEVTNAPIPDFLQPELNSPVVKKLIVKRLQYLASLPESARSNHYRYGQRLWFLMCSHGHWSSRIRLLLNHLHPSPAFSPASAQRGLQRWWIVRLSQRLFSIGFQVLGWKKE